MNENRVGGRQKQVARLSSLDRAAAEREYQRVVSDQPSNCLVLAFAKRCFPISSEKFGNRGGSFGFDHIVHIHKAPAQAIGYQRTDGSFAGAHEPCEDNATNGRSELGLDTARHVNPSVPQMLRSV